MKRTKQIREALLSFTFSTVQFEMEQQSVTAELAGEVFQMIKHLGILVLPFPNPSREALRNKFLAEFQDWLERSGYSDILVRLNAHEKQAALCEGAFRVVLTNLDSSPTGQLTPASAVWATLRGVAGAVSEVWRAATSEPPPMLSANLAILSPEMLRVDSFGRSGVDPDLVAEGFARNLGGYLKMLGRKYGWLNGDRLTIPAEAEVPAEVLRDRSTIYLAEIWNQLEDNWGKVRFFDSSDLRVTTTPNSNATGGEITTLIFTHDQQYFLDIAVARSRLMRQAFEIGMTVIYSPKTRNAIHDPTKQTVNVFPGGLISIQEAISMMVLDVCYGLNLATEKNQYLGLRLGEWLRGYALLQVCAKQSLCVVPIADGIGKLDRTAFTRLALRAGLSQESSDKFLKHATFQANSRDLWDAPILQDEAGNLILLTSLMRLCSLVEAMVSRLNSLLQQVKSKGTVFENEIREQFAKLGTKVERVKYRVGDESFECDAAVLWNDVLFLNECKAYVLPQPTAEDLFFFWNKQQDAIDQIRRVAEHFSQNRSILERRFADFPQPRRIELCVMNQAPFWTSSFNTNVRFYDRGALARFSKGSITAVIRSPRSETGNSKNEAVIDSLWEHELPTPEDLLRQMKAPYQYEREIAMWRLTEKTIALSDRLNLRLPTLGRLPDPVPEVGATPADQQAPETPEPD